jgi:hypothetical protein
LRSVGIVGHGQKLGISALLTAFATMTASPHSDAGLRMPAVTTVWLAAMAVLGCGLVFGNGRYTPLSLAAVLVALSLAWIGLMLSRRGGEGRCSLIGGVLALVLLLPELWLNALWPLWGNFAQTFWPDGIAEMMAGSGVVALCAVFIRGQAQRVAAVGMLAIFAGTAVWAGYISGDPRIDVYTFTRHAADALLHGRNPYTIHYPLIYDARQVETFYPPGVVVNGEVTVGYSYPPLPLLLFLPAHLLGDPRWALLAAMLGTAIFLFRMAPGRAGFLVAMVFLFAPRNIYTIGLSWVEPFCGLFLVGFVWSLRRGSRWAPYWFGAFLASKQFCVLMLPLALLTLPETRRPGFLLRALGLAVAVTLPFFVWNPAAFWEAVVAFHFRNPLRTDALSLAVTVYRNWGVILPPALSFGMALAALWTVSRGSQPGLLRFLGGGAVVWLVFFVTAKQAFCNYYYLALIFLAAAAAVSLPVIKSQADARPPERA